MTVFLGNNGRVRLRRATSGRTFTSVVNPDDVRVSKNRFSFNFPPEMLLTGDRLQIKRIGTGNLTFIANSGWDGGAQLPDGAWFINVDELGGIQLYDTFANALNGQATGRVSLATPSSDVDIEVTSVQSEYNVLGLVRSFELNNDREVVDITVLGDEFRKKESSLISGSGSISCEFHYDPDAAGETVDTDVPSYLHELILRQKLGAEFDAELYIVDQGQNAESPQDLFYFEFKGIVTSAAISLGAGELTVSNFNFVTTGPISPRLGVGVITNYVLKEDTDKILLEQPGSGKLELEND